MAGKRGPDSLQDYRVELRLPDAMILRVVARSLLIAVAVLALPWLRAALFSAGSADAAADLFDLDALLADLRREGLVAVGARVVFLGNAGARVGLVAGDEGVQSVPVVWEGMVGDLSVDFLLDGRRFGDDSFGFADRVLKVGGVVAARISLDNFEVFCVPENYRLAYVRQFGATVVAMKIAHVGNGVGSFPHQFSARRLMSIADASLSKSRQAHILPMAVPGSLNEYRRCWMLRMPLTADMGGWLKKHYHPTRGSEFIMIGVAQGGDAANTNTISDSMSRNVAAEDYAVSKAEAAVAVEMAKRNGVNLEYEIFQGRRGSPRGGAEQDVEHKSSPQGIKRLPGFM